MRYFTYVEPNENDEPTYYTYSEEDVILEYWSYWYDRMCEKYDKSYVDENYLYKDCIDDWIALHGAWEQDEL